MGAWRRRSQRHRQPESVRDDLQSRRPRRPYLSRPSRRVEAHDGADTGTGEVAVAPSFRQTPSRRRRENGRARSRPRSRQGARDVASCDSRIGPRLSRRPAGPWAIRCRRGAAGPEAYLRRWIGTGQELQSRSCGRGSQMGDDAPSLLRSGDLARHPRTASSKPQIRRCRVIARNTMKPPSTAMPSDRRTPDID